MLAEKLPAGAKIDPSEAMVCGLLHDIGKAALDAAMPKSHRRAAAAAVASSGDIAEFENKLLGVDHTVFGRRLAERRRLPQKIVRAIWLHHQAPEALGDGVDRELVILVSLADAIARRSGLGFSGNFTFSLASDNLEQSLGITESDSADVLARLPEELSPQVSPQPSSQGAGETSRRRQRQAPAPTPAPTPHARQDPAGLVREFMTSSSPEAAVVTVLERIAEAVATATGVAASETEPIVAYGVGQRGEGILCLRFTDGGVADCRVVAPWAELDRNSNAAGQTLLADQTALNDWIDPTKCTHIPLSCADRWVGGIFCPRQNSDKSAAGDELEMLLAAMAMVLSAAAAREQAVLVSERLTSASQKLAQRHLSLADARALAAIGEMAAGAAHELNNPLTVISGRAQLMANRAESEPAKRAWELMTAQAQRISDIVTELMEIASPPTAELQVTNSLELLNSARNLFLCSKHPQAASAQVDIKNGDCAPLICVDRTQMQMAVIELITNAVNAGGADSHVRLAVEADDINQTVLLTVADNGPGMDDQMVARVFTPFFSSQRAGRRKGLGLPRVKRLVENSGGRLWIRAAAGEGATVYIELPPAGPQNNGVEKPNDSQQTTAGSYNRRRTEDP